MKSTESLGAAFNQLRNRWKDIDAYNAAISIMYWDQGTYLPPAAASARGRQLAILTKQRHELATADEVGEWLRDAGDAARDLDPLNTEKRMLRQAQTDFDRVRRVPASLQARLSEHASSSYETWKRARANESFQDVVETLKRTLDLSREYAEALRLPTHEHIMDPLIDLADEGFTERTLTPLFKDLRARLIPLIDAVEAFDNSCLKGHFDKGRQKAFGETVIRKLGFDFNRGRQDETTHPFMIRFATDDIRITTRFKDDDLSEALFSTIHEAGHALYELGIDPEFDATPLGHGSSSGIHESQSRLWENLVGRSRAFWTHFYPQLQSAFPEAFGAIDQETFYRAINRSERSLIRTDADELTYNLHVMLRFDLEREMLSGSLKIDDLEDAWNSRYRKDLGLTPDKPSRGVLQDVHWFHGHIGGEFQGYAIGNILSAQLYAAALRAYPTLESEFAKGNFKTLREWLRRELHVHGRKYSGAELIRNATGRALDTSDYFDYLSTKYSPT